MVDELTQSTLFTVTKGVLVKRKGATGRLYAGASSSVCIVVAGSV
jgi:hypothetical protein